MPPTATAAPTALLYGTTPVRLGRVRPDVRPQALRLGAFLDKSAKPPPDQIDYLTKAAGIDRMYGNGDFGCCVWSGKAHAAGIWSGNDGAPPVLATEREVIDQYLAYTGGRDVGSVITEVLEIFRTRGITMGGVKHKIDGWVAIDNRDPNESKIGLLSLGGGCVGFNVPGEWMNTPNGGIWDTPRSYSFVGGHDVEAIDYNRTGVRVATWAGTRTITWRAFADPRIVDEFYGMLSGDWYNSDLLAPNGIDVSRLKAFLAAFANHGDLPDWEPNNPPPPPPPPPPSPPPPPGPDPYVLKGKGTVLPVKLVEPARKVSVYLGPVLGTRTIEIPAAEITVPGQTIEVESPFPVGARPGS
jgi:hypothetical protein